MEDRDLLARRTWRWLQLRIERLLDADTRTWRAIRADRKPDDKK